MTPQDQTIVMTSMILLLIAVGVVLTGSLVLVVRRHEHIRRKLSHLLGQLDISETIHAYQVRNTLVSFEALKSFHATLFFRRLYHCVTCSFPFVVSTSWRCYLFYATYCPSLWGEKIVFLTLFPVSVGLSSFCNPFCFTSKSRQKLRCSFFLLVLSVCLLRVLLPQFVDALLPVLPSLLCTIYRAIFLLLSCLTQNENEKKNRGIHISVPCLE